MHETRARRAPFVPLRRPRRRRRRAARRAPSPCRPSSRPPTRARGDASAWPTRRRAPASLPRVAKGRAARAGSSLITNRGSAAARARFRPWVVRRLPSALLASMETACSRFARRRAMCPPTVQSTRARKVKSRASSRIEVVGQNAGAQPNQRTTTRRTTTARTARPRRRWPESANSTPRDGHVRSR